MMPKPVTKTSRRDGPFQSVEDICPERIARHIVMTLRIRAGSVGQRAAFEEPFRQVLWMFLE
jgi:hypothetical protein